MSFFSTLFDLPAFYGVRRSVLDSLGPGIGLERVSRVLQCTTDLYWPASVVQRLISHVEPTSASSITRETPLTILPPMDSVQTRFYQLLDDLDFLETDSLLECQTADCCTATYHIYNDALLLAMESMEARDTLCCSLVSLPLILQADRCLGRSTPVAACVTTAVAFLVGE
mmetsp:Transcript_50403/g.126263  ORF Transcript_50403/g.126263 Transcript_50403/m.126263 type:complete len:170 (-) Transcript_50403:464-973(-)